MKFQRKKLDKRKSETLEVEEGRKKADDFLNNLIFEIQARLLPEKVYYSSKSHKLTYLPFHFWKKSQLFREIIKLLYNDCLWEKTQVNILFFISHTKNLEGFFFKNTNGTFDEKKGLFGLFKHPICCKISKKRTF